MMEVRPKRSRSSPLTAEQLPPPSWGLVPDRIANKPTSAADKRPAMTPSKRAEVEATASRPRARSPQ